MHQIIEAAVKKAILSIYNTEVPSVEFQATRKDFEGDITVVVFALLRYVKGSYDNVSSTIGVEFAYKVT